jgi:S-adenosylmethionine decarboxylase
LTLDLVRLEPSRSVHEQIAARPFAMRLLVMDAWVRDAAVLVDADGIRAVLREAADAGAATVVGERFHVFPNRAVTGVLLLAQSHLSIHTWPELLLANVDLLSYGRVDGEAVMRVVRERLDTERAHVESTFRGIG